MADMTQKEQIETLRELAGNVYYPRDAAALYAGIAALEAQTPRVLKCEKCGREISEVLVNFFDHNGADSYEKVPFEVHENGIYVDVDQNWTGYELDEEERPETIQCPHCKEFPLESTETQVYTIVRVVCFTKERGNSDGENIADCLGTSAEGEDEENG
jgi:hypothetical protein